MISPPPSTVQILEGQPVKLSVKGWGIWVLWFKTLYQAVARPRIPAYAKANLPAANTFGDGSTFSGLVYVTNDVGGATIAFTDGTSWRRVQDRAVIS